MKKGSRAEYLREAGWSNADASELGWLCLNFWDSSWKEIWRLMEADLQLNNVQRIERCFMSMTMGDKWKWRKLV